MRYEVFLTRDAERDLDEIAGYLTEHESSARASLVLTRFEELFQKLSSFPNRGSHPKELLALGIREYRQTLSSPFRIIYGILGKRVYVYLIADGRRDSQTLLARRLFEA